MQEHLMNIYGKMVLQIKPLQQQEQGSIIV
jgi:hypothetical protein